MNPSRLPIPPQGLGWKNQPARHYNYAAERVNEDLIAATRWCRCSFDKTPQVDKDARLSCFGGFVNNPNNVRHDVIELEVFWCVDSRNAKGFQLCLILWRNNSTYDDWDIRKTFC